MFANVSKYLHCTTHVSYGLLVIQFHLTNEDV